MVSLPIPYLQYTWRIYKGFYIMSTKARFGWWVGFEYLEAALALHFFHYNVMRILKR
jgi:hypothetical protein